MATGKTKTFKYWINQLHLWLGLASGLLVFIIAITGCIYAFQAEIQALTQPYRYVEARQQEYFMPSVLKEKAEQALPGKKIHAVLYSKPGKAVQVIFYSFEPEEYYYLVYLDPYTGEVLKVKNEDADFFRIVLLGHFYLWLPPEIGQPITASATLVFLIMLITGLVLWWPKNKSAAKQRFTIKWTARWRRKNYDLHNVLGFYATWIAIILAVTGLVWGFQWFAQGWYAMAGGTKSLLYEDPMSDSTKQALAGAPVIDQIWLRVKKDNPTADQIEVHVPETASSPLSVGVNPDEDTYWQYDYQFYDQYTLKELSVDHIYGRTQNATFADNLMRMNYDIHVGAIIGLPGKIIAFLASLLCASLPITGFYIWWGRRNKKADELEEDQATERKPATQVVRPVMARPVMNTNQVKDVKSQ